MSAVVPGVYLLRQPILATVTLPQNLTCGPSSLVVVIPCRCDKFEIRKVGKKNRAFVADNGQVGEGYDREDWQENIKGVLEYSVLGMRFVVPYRIPTYAVYRIGNQTPCCSCEN